MRQFRNNSDLFGELSFCLMTAGFRADKCINIQENIGRGFSGLTVEKLKLNLKKMGHRFWEQRADRIVYARKFKDKLKWVRETGNRDWLVKNIKGIGMKEASHFLRNIGVDSVAIIDFHIVDLLEKEKLIKRIKSLNKKRYLEIESILKNLAKKVGLSLGELDLYLWYIETGKILK